MKKLCLFLIVAAIACPKAFPAVKTSLRQTKGHAPTRDEAIKKALAEAVGQVRGVKIDSDDSRFNFSSSAVGFERSNTGRGREVSVDSVSVQDTGTTLTTQTQGLVKTYEVIDEREVNGDYIVTLKVWVYDYDSDYLSSRKKLAIMPLENAKGSYRFLNTNIPAKELSGKLAEHLNVLLSGTNKFSILDRGYVRAYAQEKNILLSDDSPLKEKARLGQVLGADYMLVGTISDARLTAKTIESSVTGYPDREFKARLAFNYRLILTSTRQVVLAGTVNISLETNEFKKLAKKWEPRDLDITELSANLIAMAASDVTEKIIDTLYPIRIADIEENGQVIITQGGKRITKGMLLDVFAEGKEIIDTDTNESLGKTDTIVATIKVDQVSHGISRATAIDDSPTKISEGMICRIKKTEPKTPDGFKSQIKRTSSGGVKLPFD
jgi:hypothetical protein